MSKAPLWKDCQNGTIPMLDFSVANVSQLVSASQAACLVGLAKRGFAITSYAYSKIKREMWGGCINISVPP